MLDLPLQGIFPPIATPFKDDGVDLDALRYNLTRWSRTGLDGFVALGSNGESILMKDEEKLKLIEALSEFVDRDKIIIAGTSRESTSQTIEFTNEVAEMGVDAALILPPHYYKSSMTAEALIEFYNTVADAVPIPVLVYNMPSYTGINIPAEVVVELSSNPNIIGVKDSSGNVVQIAQIISSARKGFSVLAGSGSYIFPVMTLGGYGGVPAVANVVPELLVKLRKLIVSGEYEAARRLQLSIIPLNQAVTVKYGVPGLKAAMELRGLKAGLPRKPLQALKQHAIDDIKDIMSEIGVLTEL